MICLTDFPHCFASWAEDTLFLSTLAIQLISKQLYIRYYANNTQAHCFLSVAYISVLTGRKKAWGERNGERQAESGMRLSKNIHRKLPQAESWREPSLECHHSATPTGLKQNTLGRGGGKKKGKESQNKITHRHHSQFLNMVELPSLIHLIQLIL